jgi:hypothetical protein
MISVPMLGEPLDGKAAVAVTRTMNVLCAIRKPASGYLGPELILRTARV